MTDKKQDPSSTEEKIFEAARDIFHRKGFDGARMQEIADRAEINKSMLHYYYRSKDKLFEKVYQISLMRALPQIVGLLNRDLSLDEKLRQFVREYLTVIKNNPDIPSFIIRELNTNPSRIQEFFRNQVAKRVQPFIDQVQAASDEGKIKGDLQPEHVIINTMSLVLFPFIGKPVLQIMFNMDEKSFGKFVDERIEFLPDFVVKMTLKSDDD
jgi:TetR/AcrR family transcriptional regulator